VIQHTVTWRAAAQVIQQRNVNGVIPKLTVRGCSLGPALRARIPSYNWAELTVTVTATATIHAKQRRSMTAPRSHISAPT